jgi:hypothetical protein
MNCDYVDELLPLYTGGDLDEDRSRLLATHLQSCTQCARAADEYAEVKELWQEFEPPQFSEAVYASVRRHVLTEIEQTSQARGWTSVLAGFFAPLLQPRALWVTASLLLATLLAASYFIVYRSNQSTNHQVTADVRDPAPDARDKNAVAPRENSAGISAPPSVKGPGNRPLKSGIRLRHPRPAILAATRSSDSVPVLSVPTIDPARDVTGSSSASAPLRVEIYTSDQNIRIIWLSSPRPQSGPKDPAKGI